MASGGSHGASAVRWIRAGRGVTLALHAFPSPEWVAAYVTAINASEDYRTASTEWTHGSVALVTPAQPAIGVPEDVAILLDLDRGVCRAARLLTRQDAQQAPFILTAEYRYWKQIIRKELGPIAGIMQRKLALRRGPLVFPDNVAARAAELDVTVEKPAPASWLGLPIVAVSRTIGAVAMEG